ncbi:MAG: hypothetical protein GF383_03930 [Candidatus Lokiarchaeota archaeon]|nr:hypothetical protein [Candidatus Lokiarchaeota archaeon]MBD3338874.1 hypothetical protein [Candidatus Lokiarchaeota archaeon]
MEVRRLDYKLGIFYGLDPDTVMLANKFAGHLINSDDFCKACETFDQNVKCDKCREELSSYAQNLYFFEKIGGNLPSFIEEPEEYLPKNLPYVDYLLVVGIHQDLVSGLPDYLETREIKAVIIPLEDPSWVPPGLQVQVLKEFEKRNIQAAFPKPFCALSKTENEYNQVGFNITENHSHIDDFIDYFKIGEPKVSFLLSKDGEYIEDACVLRSAPCGSTYYIVQQLQSKYFKNGKANDLPLNERISKAHHAYPCNASMDQDSILKDSCLHIGGYKVRNAIRRALDLEEQEGKKLKYVIK